MIGARVLIADPPWSFGDRLPGATRGAEKNYRVLSTEDICRFELPPLDDNAWLFLWRVSSQVEEAYRVVRAWGFVPKSEIVWEKLTSNGKPWFGMGRYVRASHETCIVAVRGRVKPKVRNIRSRFSAPAGRHSEKPECFYSIVESLADGPYIELFARRRRPGWTSFGNELGADFQLPSGEPEAEPGSRSAQALVRPAQVMTRVREERRRLLDGGTAQRGLARDRPPPSQSHNLGVPRCEARALRCPRVSRR